jgi:hypothetical protein
MTVDETFKGVNRIWQEISVIVVTHAVAIALAIYGHLIPLQVISQGAKSLASLPELSAFRDNLQHLGLDLPFVVGTVVVVYVVLFQRLSSAMLQIPGFKLFYSQTALWRAGKCFDELRQLARWSEGYAASTDLEDLEVMLGLAITQYAKDYKEHYNELVETRLSAAAIWMRYYSGLCLLALAGIVFIAAIHPTARAVFLPGGLLMAACIARCGWEVQIERAVAGRLRFAIDCAIVSGVKQREQRDAESRQEHWKHSDSNRLSELEILQDTENDDKRLLLNLALAADFLRLPPPFLPYQHYWTLHYLRSLWPFKGAGALPLMQNNVFREWLVRSVRFISGSLHDQSNDDEGTSQRQSEFRKMADYLLQRLAVHEVRDSRTVEQNRDKHLEQARYRLRELLESIDFPKWIPDDRLVARLLRKCVPFAKWPFPGLFLVDEPERYSRARAGGSRWNPSEEQSLREWAARRGNS